MLGKTFAPHRAQEFRQFLDLSEESVPVDLEALLILDNSSTHETSAIRTWPLKHPRFHVHLTPTSSSWLNLVERWFAALTERQLRRNSFRSIVQLVTCPPLPSNIVAETDIARFCRFAFI